MSDMDYFYGEFIVLFQSLFFSLLGHCVHMLYESILDITLNNYFCFYLRNSHIFGMTKLDMMSYSYIKK